MHEFSLITDLMRKIGAIACEQGAARISGVKVKLGALAHISGEHFREHFEQAALGTPAEGSRLDIDVSTDESDPHAQDILLQSVDVEEE
ncbi:MAG: hydrogenase maturation nickel metallochaperone HypA [Terrimicrobiaceae bacterium]